MELKRQKVTGLNGKGETVELAVLKPNERVLQDAQMQYHLKMASLIRQGANGGDRLLLKAELEQALIQMGVWSLADATRFFKIGGEIRTCELILKKGGIKVSEGKAIALKMSELRSELMVLYAKRSQYDNTTIEATAETHRLRWIATACVVYAETGRPYFTDINDFIDRQNEPVAIECAKVLAKILFGYQEDAVDRTPESQWLREFNFIDEKGRLIDKDGRLIDVSGRLVDENGRFIDENGSFVDANGNLLDADMNYVVNDSKPFIDDETGEPVGDKAPEPVPSGGAHKKPRKRVK